MPHLSAIGISGLQGGEDVKRYTEPEPELKLLLDRLRLELPAQPPPKITTVQAEAATLA